MTSEQSEPSAAVAATEGNATKPYRILSLDGGGSKGFYTLGVLREVEALAGSNLCNHFDLIYGTSTGAIIASLLALGESVDDVHDLYKNEVPRIMQERKPIKKSAALAALANEVFSDKQFSDVKTGVGVVATKWLIEKPMIFKANVEQAHGRHNTFVPGFGVPIGEAVQASCSAVPFFKPKVVETSTGDSVELIDGGYCANNPTLYAIADATRAMRISKEDIRVLSVGVGVYPEPPLNWKMRLAWRYVASLQLLHKTLEINTHSMEQLRAVLFKDIRTVRICETFERPEMATNFMEYDLAKLNILRQRGGESYASQEDEVKSLFS